MEGEGVAVHFTEVNLPLKSGFCQSFVQAESEYVSEDRRRVVRSGPALVITNNINDNDT